jgi:hypothetical protein
MSLPIAFFWIKEWKKHNFIVNFFSPFKEYLRYWKTTSLIFWLSAQFSIYSTIVCTIICICVFYIMGIFWVLLVFILAWFLNCISIYVLTPYILKETDLKGELALELSKKMINWHKGELFKLIIIFIILLFIIILYDFQSLYLLLYLINWHCSLSVLSVNLLTLWVLCFLIPYFYTTLAIFYEKVKEDHKNQNKEEIRPKF